MFARIAILLLTCCSLAAIPRGSTRDELQRLARTPRIEFAAPLEFNRIAGFRVFPDRSAMAEAAAEIVKDSKSGDADAAALLEAARLHDQSRGRISALTLYFDAAKLFQQRAETFPSDPAPLLGWAGCFDAANLFSQYAFV